MLEVSVSNAKNTSSMKIRTHIIALCAMMLFACRVESVAATATNLALMPQPRSVELSGGAFAYNPTVGIVAEEWISSYVSEYLRFGFGPVAIAIRQDGGMKLPAEGYELVVAPEGIVLRGVDRAGVINGFHTLLQLFPNAIYSSPLASACEIPCLRIVDWPEYSYRGQHLDVARTYSSVEQIKEFISHIAHHKLNHLHLHLTDDEGWRVEILSHPELTEVAAYRGGDSPIWPIYGAFDQKYGGYYTQSQLRELVEYAAQRGVTIVPEIDLPGHSLAIGKVHPEILCPVERDNSASAGYDRRNVWCVSREENYDLLEDILSELCDIFPSEYIHIGGDEVDMSQWRDCPHCSALYNAKGMTSRSELHSYFMQRLMEILSKRGRKAAMWNEAAESGVIPHSVRMHGWEGLEECREVAEAGYKTVVMPGPYFYFDMRQSKNEDGHNWAGVVTTKKCYSVDLTQQGYSPRARRNVEGFSGAFWSELYVTHKDKYENYLEYQTFPRICALSEVCWLPQSRREWSDFERRLELHKGRMDAMGISYRKGEPVPPAGRQITPGLKVTTSLPMSRDNALEKLSAYANDYGYRTKRTCHEGDWILYEFAGALKKGTTVELTTGYRHVARGLFPSGVVEVSADGDNFTDYATLHNGSCTIRLEGPTRAIRLRSTRTGNGDSYVFVQYPVIRVE